MIPKAVINYDMDIPTPPTTFKLNSVTPMPTVSIAFGRSLQDLASLEGWSLDSNPAIPHVVKQLTDHLRERGKLPMLTIQSMMNIGPYFFILSFFYI